MTTARWHQMPRGDREAACSVVAFLVYAEADRPAAAYGTWRVTEALEAACHLIGCSAADVRREVLGDNR